MIGLSERLKMKEKIKKTICLWFGHERVPIEMAIDEYYGNGWMNGRISFYDFEKTWDGSWFAGYCLRCKETEFLVTPKIKIEGSLDFKRGESIIRLLS